MEVITHQINQSKIAEVISTDIVIATNEGGTNLLMDLYYQDFDSIILHEKNITPDFFDLKSGLAGEILQKFSNYWVRLALVGNFGKYPSKSFRDFMLESNKGRQVNFVGSVPEALVKLSR